MKKIVIIIIFFLVSIFLYTPVFAVDEWCMISDYSCYKLDTGPCEKDIYKSEATCKAAAITAQKNASDSAGKAGGTNPNCTIKGGKCTPLENPLGTTDINKIMGKLINTAMGILGALALLVFVVGGFLWLTAAGKEDQIKKGTHAMMWAVIGIIVIFSSYAILTLVLRGLGVVQNSSSSVITPSSSSNKSGSCKPITSATTICKNDIACTKEFCVKNGNVCEPMVKILNEMCPGIPKDQCVSSVGCEWK